jgi:hypothetical protein
VRFSCRVTAIHASKVKAGGLRCGGVDTVLSMGDDGWARSRPGDGFVAAWHQQQLAAPATARDRRTCLLLACRSSPVLPRAWRTSQGRAYRSQPVLPAPAAGVRLTARQLRARRPA